jgi:hypothetical protein
MNQMNHQSEPYASSLQWLKDADVTFLHMVVLHKV